MSIGALTSEGDLRRWLQRELGDAHGLLKFANIAGRAGAEKIGWDLGSSWEPVWIGATSVASPTANSLYVARVRVLAPCTLAGVEFRPTNTTGSVKSVLYAGDGSEQLAAGGGVALAGSGFGAQQQVAFATAYEALPGVYQLGLAFNNASSGYVVPTGVWRGSSHASSYSTLPSSITPGTDFAGSPMPLMALY